MSSRLVAVHALKVAGAMVSPGSVVDPSALSRGEVERLLGLGAVAPWPRWAEQRIAQLEERIGGLVESGQRTPLSVRLQAELAALRGELSELRREVGA